MDVSSLDLGRSNAALFFYRKAFHRDATLFFYGNFMMGSARLGSAVRVAAIVRRLDIAGIAVALLRRGEAGSGAILLKCCQRDLGCSVLVEARDIDNQPFWRRGTGAELVPEATADAYIERQCHYDPDAWVVEIDDRQGRHLLDEPVR